MFYIQGDIKIVTNILGGFCIDEDYSEKFKIFI